MYQVIFKGKILLEDKIVIAVIRKYIFEFPGIQDKKETVMDDEVFTFDKRKHSSLLRDHFFLELKFASYIVNSYVKNVNNEQLSAKI